MNLSAYLSKPAPPTQGDTSHRVRRLSGTCALLAAFLLPSPAYCEPSPWLALFPGGGQYLLGQKGEAAAWAGSTLGLTGWGLAVKKDDPGQLNAPLLYAQQVYVAGMYAAYRDLRLRSGDKQAPPVDPASTWQLATAPFRAENLKSPWVYGALAVGGGLNYVLARAAAGRRSYNDLTRFRYLGSSAGRGGGTALYSAYWIPLSLGAGVSEEGLFRGMIQAEAERRWGPKTGLYAASGLFGAAHVLPLDGDSWSRVLFGAAAGLYLGSLYQREGYRLAKPVAAHFWWDCAAGLAAFLANPRENGIGAKVDFPF